MLIYLQMIENEEEKLKFIQIYEKYKDLMFYVAKNILGNDADAEDAVHEAFLASLKHLYKFSKIECPETRSYFVTIVENKAIDIYRKRQRSVNIGLGEWNPAALAPDSGSGRLSRCIAQLPPTYRHVLVLHQIHGYKYKEIAKILDMTVANALKINQRAVAKLEKICIEEGVL